MKYPYYAVHDWMVRHPRFRKGLHRTAKLCTLVVYGGYPLGVLWCWAHRVQGDLGPVVRMVAIPGITFVLGSWVRQALNRPRPYEVMDLPPVFPKNTKGKSFPSRHVFSAAVIAAAMGYLHPGLGWAFGSIALFEAACRVVGGVHWLRDVAAGLVFGGVMGYLGFFVL